MDNRVFITESDDEDVYRYEVEEEQQYEVEEEQQYEVGFKEMEHMAPEEETDPQIRRLADFLNPEHHPEFNGAPKSLIITRAKNDPRHKIWHMPTFITAMVLIINGEENNGSAIARAVEKYSEYNLVDADILRYIRLLKLK